jgi:hypothetical protein
VVVPHCIADITHAAGFYQILEYKIWEGGAIVDITVVGEGIGALYIIIIVQSTKNEAC